jgi:hypothetical protein
MIRNLAVLDAVRDAIFLADIDTGMIVDANPCGATEVLHLRGCGPGVACLEKLSPTRHATERRKPTLDLAGSGP